MNSEKLKINGYFGIKAKERRRKLEFIENKLNKCERLCAAKPTESNIENFQKYKFEYDSLFDYIAQGNIVLSRETWYEKGERNNKYFLNLEKLHTGIV